MKRIQRNEVQFVKKSQDENRLFLWNEELFRVITNSDCQGGRWQRLNDFFTSDSYFNLVEKKYIPLISPTDLVLEDFPGVIYKVPLIPHVTEPLEWTTVQWVDALKLICLINLSLVSTGSKFLANDCNLAQMTFRNGRPIFLDLGSFSDQGTRLAKEKFSQDMAACAAPQEKRLGFHRKL